MLLCSLGRKRSRVLAALLRDLGVTLLDESDRLHFSLWRRCSSGCIPCIG